MKVDEAADQLGVTSQTIRKYLKSGKLNSTREQRPGKGFHYEISEEDVRNYQLERLSERPTTSSNEKHVTSPDSSKSVSSGLESMVALLSSQIEKAERQTERFEKVSETATMFQSQAQQLQEQLQRRDDELQQRDKQLEQRDERIRTLEDQVTKLLPAPAGDEQATTPLRRSWRTLWLKKG